MYKKELLKSMIGEKTIISVKDYEGEFVVDRSYAVMTEEECDYYSSDDFILYDHEEILPRVYKIYLKVVD